MKPYQVEILKAAKLDLRHAKNWYNTQRENLGNEFLFEIEKSLKQIQAYPEQFPKNRNEIRKAVLKRFPYCLYFAIKLNTIKIIAVFHNSRNPIIWEKRNIID
jgi:plasmid stabilization system protein ParE